MTRASWVSSAMSARNAAGATFRFDTAVPGNGNAGHEGKAYGTELPDDEKIALVEYLKTF